MKIRWLDSSAYRIETTKPSNSMHRERESLFSLSHGDGQLGTLFDGIGTITKPSETIETIKMIFGVFYANDMDKNGGCLWGQQYGEI